ncbi:MAG: hypothetical protein OQK51_25005 [Kangiellaceae bacterium]|nr:hypothetical protein [Kangiellaceae bacterium]
MNLDREPDKVDIVAIATDGGTMVLDVYVSGEILNLYVDNRINTSTPKQIYTSYPDEDEAVMLESSSKLVLGIKKLIEADNA